MIKTIQARDIQEFDNLVNMEELDPKKSVFATQTHVNTLEGQATIYTAVIFYKVRT